MNLVALLLVASLATLTETGCSIYEAASQPPPADLTGIGIGTPRGQVIAKLGAPKFSDTDPEGRSRTL
jgi:outer membrane protein assembly factor BamE (lipoprotein component of BamABCDE complex)